MAKKTNNGNNVKCSFCGKEPSFTDILVPSPLGETYICSDCVQQIEGLLKDYFADQESHHGKKGKAKSDLPQTKELPTPRQICDFLDQYVIGLSLIHI